MNLWYTLIMKYLTESLEKYLLAIYELSKINDNIIVKDVANYLNIGGASTADAIKTLTNRGFINYIPYSPITLTYNLEVHFSWTNGMIILAKG